MKYLKELNDGDRVSDVYLCKHSQTAMTKTGKEYINLVLQDKTGSIDAKIWDPGSGGISDFKDLDYIYIMGDAHTYNGAIQISVSRLKVAHDGEFVPADYLPMSQYDNEEMYKELKAVCDTVKNEYLHRLLLSFFSDDPETVKKFRMGSAAKQVHHGFVGGLMQHTLSVTRLCKYYVKMYPILNHDLLITAALLHDIGKIRELSPFPMNDYTDDGQLLGHIVMGAEMIAEHASKIEGFPDKLNSELQHCILAHHGELEFGSPKTPELMEAMALNLADNTDAKMESMTELLGSTTEKGWLGYNRIFEANVRKSSEWN